MYPSLHSLSISSTSPTPQKAKRAVHVGMLGFEQAVSGLTSLCIDAVMKQQLRFQLQEDIARAQDDPEQTTSSELLDAAYVNVLKSWLVCSGLTERDTEPKLQEVSNIQEAIASDLFLLTQPLRDLSVRAVQSILNSNQSLFERFQLRDAEARQTGWRSKRFKRNAVDVIGEASQVAHVDRLFFQRELERVSSMEDQAPTSVATVELQLIPTTGSPTAQGHDYISGERIEIGSVTVVVNVYYESRRVLRCVSKMPVNVSLARGQPAGSLPHTIAANAYLAVEESLLTERSAFEDFGYTMLCKQAITQQVAVQSKSDVCSLASRVSLSYLLGVPRSVQGVFEQLIEYSSMLALASASSDDSNARQMLRTQYVQLNALVMATSKSSWLINLLTGQDRRWTWISTMLFYTLATDVSSFLAKRQARVSVPA